MGRVVLVSDVQTPLGEELARRYLAEGASVAVTRSNQQSRESPLVSESDGFLLTDWNRRSPISTRNVLLSVRGQPFRPHQRGRGAALPGRGGQPAFRDLLRIHRAGRGRLAQGYPVSGEMNESKS